MRPAGAWFGLFAALVAAALVLDQLWWGGFEVPSWHGLVVLAAFGVLTAPTSVVRFALLLAATVVSVGADLPAVGTHRLVLLVVAGAVLAQLVVLARRRPEPDAVMAALAPFLRATVVVVYLGSALAKVNASFLDPAVSCALRAADRARGVEPPRRPRGGPGVRLPGRAGGGRRGDRSCARRPDRRRSSDAALRARPGPARRTRGGGPLPARRRDRPRVLGPLPPGETLAGRLGIFRDVPPPGVPRC